MNSIYHRISVRKYEDRQVEKEKVTEILRAGMQAPSAGNQQPWEFYVVTNQEKKDQLSKTSPYAGPATKAPVVIVPVYRKNGRFPSMILEDMSICAENMWLMADSLGLDAAGVSKNADEISKLLASSRSLMNREEPDDGTEEIDSSN